MHPLINNLADFETKDIVKKLSDLHRKMASARQMGMTIGLLDQMQVVINQYTVELTERQQKEYAQILADADEDSDGEFDDIINIGS
jgi:hypothetical protein